MENTRNARASQQRILEKMLWSTDLGAGRRHLPEAGEPGEAPKEEGKGEKVVDAEFEEVDKDKK